MTTVGALLLVLGSVALLGLGLALAKRKAAELESLTAPNDGEYLS